MALSQRRRQLLDTDRWRPLGAFVERWYANPLSDSDGNTQQEIELTATRLASTVPPALAEWYELVGRRLRSVQDSPRLLSDLSIKDGCVRVWIENQGVWSILTRVDDGDDPRCFVDDNSFVSPDAPLSRTLLAMLVSDTLVGAWAGSRVGALGGLAPTVCGGSSDDFTEGQVRSLCSTYAPLGHPRNPFFGEPYRGDESTLIRIQDVAVEWMTATDEAFAAFDKVFGLAPEGGVHEVVVAFDVLSSSQLQQLTYVHESSMRLPDVDRFQKVLAGAGHVGIAVGGDAPRFHIRTRVPHRVLALILDALQPDLLAHVTVATRPAAISVFEVLYPAGKRVFVLPA